MQGQGTRDDCFDVLRGGLDIVLACLDDADGRARMYAAELEGYYIPDVERVASSLHAWLNREPEAEVRAALVLVLAKVSGYDPAVLEAIQPMLRDEQEPLVRLAASIALILAHGDAAPDVAVEMLVAALDPSRFARRAV
jgi:hypothetical protein